MLKESPTLERQEARLLYLQDVKKRRRRRFVPSPQHNEELTIPPVDTFDSRENPITQTEQDFTTPYNGSVPGSLTRFWLRFLEAGRDFDIRVPHCPRTPTELTQLLQEGRMMVYVPPLKENNWHQYLTTKFPLLAETPRLERYLQPNPLYLGWHDIDVFIPIGSSGISEKSMRSKLRESKINQIHPPRPERTIAHLIHYILGSEARKAYLNTYFDEGQTKTTVVAHANHPKEGRFKPIRFIAQYTPDGYLILQPGTNMESKLDGVGFRTISTHEKI